MDKFNPRNNDSIYDKYKKIIEAMPYDGIHINHQDKIKHIKNIYGNQYKVTQSPSSKSWYVLGKNGNEWIPVTSSFADKEGATKFMQWLTRAGEMQKKMVGTIDGTDKRLNEEEERIDESVGGRLHGLFGDLFDYLDNEFYGASIDLKGTAGAKINSTLKRETEKLYKTWQKALKGKGLIGW
jgi:hypothetical protein